MSTIANNINTYADMTAYNADTNKDYPNVSYISGTDEVKYATDPRVVCVYNVTDTSTATSLLYSTTDLSDMIIDGVMQPSVVTSYQFSTTGEHIVKFGLTYNWTPGRMFQSCRSLTSVTIPNSVTSIASNTFNGCSGLTSINIPNGVTSIGGYVFQSCSNLTNINIPNGVTSIGQDCFNGCRRLISFTCEATTPPSIASRTFTSTNNCPIYVPAESVDTYKAAEFWSSLASRIQAIPTT